MRSITENLAKKKGDNQKGYHPIHLSVSYTESYCVLKTEELYQNFREIEIMSILEMSENF